MAGLLLAIAAIALVASLFAVSGGVAGTATATVRLLALCGALACAFLGLVWVALGGLAEGCENSCPPESVETLIFRTGAALALISVSPPTLMLVATALTGQLRYARKTWIFVVAAVVVFAAWFIGWGIVVNATRSG